MTISFYEVLLFGHLVSLVVGFGAVIVIDSFGLAWLVKWRSVTLSLVTRVAEVTQRLIWLGFLGLVLTGSGMVMIRGGISDIQWIKLFLVAMVGVNGVFLHTIKKQMESIKDDAVPRSVMFRIGLASTISQIGWWGATLIGFYLSNLS